MSKQTKQGDKKSAAQETAPSPDNPWARALADQPAAAREMDWGNHWCGVTDLLHSEVVDTEFPAGADRPPGADPGDAQQRLEIHRRDMLKIMGASAALAGIGGCIEERPDKLMPYSMQPPEVTPAVPRMYATSMVVDGFATGVLVQSRDGRPIKVEGNPEHPASLGATDVFAQASVLQLYDPDRAHAITRDGVPSSWLRFYAEVADTARPGLRFLLPPQTSPLMANLIEQVQRLRPDAGFTFYAPLERRAAYAGSRLVFGRPLEPHYDFRQAKIILSLDADFTASMPMSVRWARDFAAARRLSSPLGEMNRLYMAEAMPSPTGTVADHRLRVRSGDVAAVAARVLAALVDLDAPPPNVSPAVIRDIRAALAALPQPYAPAAETPAEQGQHDAWIGAVVRDLRAGAGAGIVIAGPRQPAETHALAYLINAALGNLGRTVTLTEPAVLAPEGGTLAELVEDMNAGLVDTLVILELDPAYTAPVDLAFERALAQVPNSVHLSLFRNETSALCRWFLPSTHFMESWGDARAYDGTISFVQPLLEPLYGGRSPEQVVAAFAGQAQASDYVLLHDFWRGRLAAAAGAAAAPAAPAAQALAFEQLWERYVQLGFIPGTTLPPVTRTVDVQWRTAAALMADALRPRERAGLELSFEQSPKVYDGRYANNAWLLELPHPLTKLTWDNAAIISPRTAARLGLETTRVVILRLGERSLRAPILVLPGHADESVTLALGYGREGAESLARGVGVNAYRLRTTDAMHYADGLQLEKTGDAFTLAFTQNHWRLHDRPIALITTLDAYRRQPTFTEPLKGPVPSLLPPYPEKLDKWALGIEQWAMSIDTMICTGCSACVIACQAENNIPVVGKEGVERSREMHWLRIDRYYVGPAEEPRVINQPMLCQHCEKAPCEYVCPVNATVHSPDGLNEMVYNRCIGTRFCSNNCPYKVRRFNWFEYTGDATTERLQRNPEVTVRERGVMEKCTYCVQRIRRAEIDARIDDRSIAPGEVVTACQQACPTGAIQFGSLRHQDTAVVEWREQHRSYAVLHNLGTQPRTMYLAKIVNLAPELK